MGLDNIDDMVARRLVHTDLSRRADRTITDDMGQEFIVTLVRNRAVAYLDKGGPLVGVASKLGVWIADEWSNRGIEARLQSLVA